MPVPLPFETTTRLILVWPGEEDQEITSAGEVVTMPARNKVHPASRWQPAVLDGKPLPGTVVIHDRMGMSKDGGRVKTFDAAEFAHLLYNNNTALVNRGFAIVRTPEEVAQAMAEGIPKWEAALAKSDEEEIRTEMSRRAQWERQGQPAPPPTSVDSLAKAVRRMESRQRKLAQSGITDDALRRALGDLPAAPAAPTRSAPVVPPPAPEPEQQPGDSRGAVLMAQAEELNLYLKRDELAGILKNDPAVLSAVEARIAEARGQGTQAVAS